MGRAENRSTSFRRARIFSCKRIAITLTAVAAFLVAGVGGAAAHHGWSGYDSNTFLILSGVIQTVDYANPHVMIGLEVPPVPEEDGTIEDPPLMVSVVLAPPSRSESRGLMPEMLQVGTTATVEGYPSRTDVAEMRAERITVHDLTFEMR